MTIEVCLKRIKVKLFFTLIFINCQLIHNTNKIIKIDESIIKFKEQFLYYFLIKMGFEKHNTIIPSKLSK